jgi:hypothetical protein
MAIEIKSPSMSIVSLLKRLKLYPEWSEAEFRIQLVELSRVPPTYGVSIGSRIYQMFPLFWNDCSLTIE